MFYIDHLLGVSVSEWFIRLNTAIASSLLLIEFRIKQYLYLADFDAKFMYFDGIGNKRRKQKKFSLSSDSQSPLQL